MNEREAKEQVVKAGIKLVESGLIARTWGNVSCRISKTHFVITPSGRDYLQLTPEEIVTVAIEDLSYAGDIKPSGEKAVHGVIYSHYDEAQFIIHTHQENASVVSTLGIDEVVLEKESPLLGTKIVCASYGLPGTKKLRNGIANALTTSNGNAVIMKHHGAVCYGKTPEEAFQTAEELEVACLHFLQNQFLNIKKQETFDLSKMNQYALTQIAQKWKDTEFDFSNKLFESKRKENGFILYESGEKVQDVTFGQSMKGLPKECVIHEAIYKQNKRIHFIVHSKEADILTVSRGNVTLYPLVDDFAQLIGTKVKTVLKDPNKIADALKKADAVFLGNHGALCCGTSEADAAAVVLIMKKCCKALLYGTLFGGAKTISPLDSTLMRVVYLKKYAKQITTNKK